MDQSFLGTIRLATKILFGSFTKKLPLQKKSLNLKRWANKIIRYFLLFLFLGYFGSITFFSHTHYVENGIIIVHSHPFSSGTDTNPVSHQHSANGFILIHFLSHFITTVCFLLFAIKPAIRFFKKFILLTVDEDVSNLLCFSSNGLRAPPY